MPRDEVPVAHVVRQRGCLVKEHPALVVPLLERHMGQVYNSVPIVDKTGLSNYYDFSLEWTPKLQKGDINQDDVEAILKDWGLGLQPETDAMEMLVVKKAN